MNEDKKNAIRPNGIIVAVRAAMYLVGHIEGWNTIKIGKQDDSSSGTETT
jgi:hypothetical protein